MMYATKCPAMHFEMDKICGGNAFAYPKRVLETELRTQNFCLQRWRKRYRNSEMTLQIPLLLLFPMIFHTGGIEW